MSDYCCPDCGELLVSERDAEGYTGRYLCPLCLEFFDPNEDHLSQVPDNADEWVDARE